MGEATATQQHVKEVCRIGQGHDCCRYLAMSSKYGWTCEKHSGLAARLDARAEAGLMTARADNCAGFWDTDGGGAIKPNVPTPVVAATDNEGGER